MVTKKKSSSKGGAATASPARQLHVTTVRLWKDQAHGLRAFGLNQSLLGSGEAGDASAALRALLDALADGKPPPAGLVEALRLSRRNAAAG